jgi:hypothetical protein
MRPFWLLLAILVGGGVAAWLIGSDSPLKAPNVPPPALTPAPVAPPKAPAAVAPSPLPKPEQPPGQALGATKAAVRIIDARTIRLDDRFDVFGRGTSDEPFRIAWPILEATMDSIDGRAGKLDVPAWIEPLNGAWIELSGYFAPVAQAEETDELLFTMNRWDGCCIGLPPTVFDSIALRLDRTISLTGQHLIRFGTVRGQLHIEPFAVGGMMLGLYRLEHGTITSNAGSG